MTVSSGVSQARYVQAKLSVHDRSLKVATVIESLEMEMELLCLTGVEDQLQADVRPTLEILRNAGIKVRRPARASAATRPATRARVPELDQSSLGQRVKERGEGGGRRRRGSPECGGRGLGPVSGGPLPSLPAPTAPGFGRCRAWSPSPAFSPTGPSPVRAGPRVSPHPTGPSHAQHAQGVRYIPVE